MQRKNTKDQKLAKYAIQRELVRQIRAKLGPFDYMIDKNLSKKVVELRPMKTFEDGK